jgi:hypothetical protein
VADVERVRLEIGFEGGQISALIVTAPTADELEHALEAGRDEALSIEAEDGRYTIPLSRIAYVKRFARESRVGFGSGP